jgi:hypothetical protein
MFERHFKNEGQDHCPKCDGTEYEQIGDNWLFFGKVVSSNCPESELGYFTLDELKKARFPPFGLGVERDMYWHPKPISQCK